MARPNSQCKTAQQNRAVDIPIKGRTLFLPQKPYLPIGTLRSVLSYPKPPSAFDDAAMREVLTACALPHLAGRLDESRHWALELSPGEQQRIAFARALLQRPEWLFLDEATAALDDAREARLYRLITQRLPGTALVNVGHRPALAAFHEGRLELGGLSPWRERPEGREATGSITKPPVCVR